MTMLTVVLPWERPTKTTEFPYVLSDDGRTARRDGVAVAALLPAARQLLLVVPAARLSWFDLKLPPVSGARLRQALEGLLEERLLDEPAQMALAVTGTAEPDGQTLVAACEKSWLAEVLVFFEQLQRPVSRVVPEFAPTQAVGVYRLVATSGEDGPLLALCSPGGCLQVPLAQAPVLLAQAQGVFAEAVLRSDPEVAAQAEQVLDRPAEVAAAHERWLVATQWPWNLAQFDLAQTGGNRLARRLASGWRQFARAPDWRPVRWALGLLVVANLVGLNAWAWQQDRLVQAQRDAVRGVLARTFPGVRTIVDAPLQMAREVALLRQASGGSSAGDLEVLLAALGSALPDGMHPTRIEFGNGELRAEGLALDAERTPQVIARLEAAGAQASFDAGRMVLRAGGRQ